MNTYVMLFHTDIYTNYSHFFQ